MSADSGYGDGVVVRTGADGAYRLDGLPAIDGEYRLSVMPPQDSAYLHRRADIPSAPGYAPLRHDFALVKGATVTGRVTDAETGRGVQAGVRLAPLPENTYFGTKPGFDRYRTDRTMETTDADGRFRVVTIPGDLPAARHRQSKAAARTFFSSSGRLSTGTLVLVERVLLSKVALRRRPASGPSVTRTISSTRPVLPFSGVVNLTMAT